MAAVEELFGQVVQVLGNRLDAVDRAGMTAFRGMKSKQKK
jgi:hypothetical protein